MKFIFAAVASSLCISSPLSVAYGAEKKPQKPKTFAAAEKGCDKGDLLACATAAEYLAYGENGAPEDNDRARELATKACDGGLALGCRWQARTSNSDEGKVLFMKACDMNDGEACWMLAGIIKNDAYLSSEDRAKAMPLFKRALDLFAAACKEGDIGSCVLEADMYYHAGRDGLTEVVPEDRERATKVFETGCKKNDSHACWLLGHAYEFGHGHVGQNDKKAKASYDKACKLGNSLGCESRDDLVKERREQGIII